MKRLILILIMIFTFITGNSQLNVKNLTFDTGYYEGICPNDNPKSKYLTYLYIQFLSNGGDSMLAVVPYRMKITTNSNTYVKYITAMNDTIDKYLSELATSVGNIESNEIINRSWSISGFDNLTYFETDSNKISFSINIADYETGMIEVFYFDGTIDRYGDEINAVIYSEGGTFPKGEIKLQLGNRLMHQK